MFDCKVTRTRDLTDLDVTDIPAIVSGGKRSYLTNSESSYICASVLQLQCFLWQVVNYAKQLHKDEQAPAEGNVQPALQGQGDIEAACTKALKEVCHFALTHCNTILTWCVRFSGVWRRQSDNSAESKGQAAHHEPRRVASRIAPSSRCRQ